MHLGRKHMGSATRVVVTKAVSPKPLHRRSWKHRRRGVVPHQVPRQLIALHMHVCVCVCVCVCARARARVRLSLSVRVWVCVCVCIHACKEN